MIRACRLANQDAGILEVEQEMDALEDRIEEPWEDPAPLRPAW